MENYKLKTTINYNKSLFDSGANNNILRFEQLKNQIGNAIRGMWDVYTDSQQNLLIYVPISTFSFIELTEERDKLSKGGFTLIGIEVARNDISGYHPEAPKKRGCYWVTEWLSQDFVPSKKPKSFQELKRRIEKGSGWLKGGPR
jgi:hypothetical protein